jgi:hypothetical protein
MTILEIGISFPIFFHASGRCSGCQGNSHLFGEGISGRCKLKSNHKANALNNGDLVKLLHKTDVNSGSVKEECCPCEASMEEEFLLSFNATIAGLVDSRDLINVVGVNGNISELEIIDCPADQTDLKLVLASCSMEIQTHSHLSRRAKNNGSCFC